MSCRMPIRFQRSKKRSLAFTSLTLGTAGPLEIVSLEQELVKNDLRKHSKLFERHHNNLNHCIASFVISTKKFCSEILIQIYRNFCSIFDIISHNGEVVKNNLFLNFAKTSPAALKLRCSRFVLIVFLDESKCFSQNVSCGSKIPDRALLNGTILLSLPDYKQTDLVHVLRLVTHPDCIS